MADTSEYDLLIGKITKTVTGMARFDEADTMIKNPTPAEYERAILDGVEDINLYKPMTQYSVESMYAKGSRWQRVIYLATEINIYKVLVKDWVANGMDVDLGDLSLPSKLGDYQGILADLEGKFQETLEAMKSGGPVTRSSSFVTNIGATSNTRSSAYLEALKNQLDKNNTVY